jgi:two-component system, sporulation sensor kinase E
MKSAFIDKLLERLDKLDPESLQNQFLGLVQERGLLETIFQSIKEGVIVVDGEGKMTYANRAAEQLLGFTFSESRGRPVSRELREIDWYRVLNVGDSEWSKLISREIEITYPQSRIVNVYAVPLSSEEDGSDGAVIILRDITHERLKEASLLASERIDAVKLLAAGVAHEIGNPLNALHIHLQLLEREIRALPDDQATSLRELVEIAGAEIQRLDLTISQFLKAIRPSEPNFEATNIDKLLEETLHLLKLEIQNRKIDVQINRPDALPSIKVDPDQMKQVFFNVTKNAFQAMPDGGSLCITLSNSDEFLGVVFEDSGIGIDPDDLGRIFEPYHTTKSEGSGLGLMVVQRIVQDHGGQIEIESKQGRGTRFTVLLPLTEKRVRLLSSPSSSVEAEKNGVTDVEISNGVVR